ncbi:MAG: hypothetical protein J3R72DRAFT_172818 [Linnemannia gamsii]|nr:MAG: hypothetical protein J3R72DRAFT_172818 [Linnemannia gamsii]
MESTRLLILIFASVSLIPLWSSFLFFFFFSFLCFHPLSIIVLFLPYPLLIEHKTIITKILSCPLLSLSSSRKKMNALCFSFFVSCIFSTGDEDRAKREGREKGEKTRERDTLCNKQWKERKIQPKKKEKRTRPSK